jgi:hypothetical protein
MVMITAAVFAEVFLSASSILTLAVIAVDIALITFLSTQQSLPDLISRTLVVNTPPVQPHRAPAGPMYSASDAEFGIPPRKMK